ncbi:Uncharacterised protein [Metamycoplasma arthritidis]|uniref:Hypothetical lipoprotein n=1 Tax=Metamycoplasma arthritidis (strain 158L3-1) TaxID=243272 RepID=B3PNC8_META1|nr:variable surface lipoprotein [Metamycoplasma arthritidis]ACF07530.1 hypothetical lipoprotein [Metamycoplasma arthritidis 158L3-1]VEU79038.1 Uncharacterised protein [Metamycoplasma arthritidis]
MKKSLKFLLGILSTSPLVALPLVVASCGKTITEFKFDEALKSKKPSEIKQSDFTTPTGASNVQLKASDKLGVLVITYKLNSETKTHLITGFAGEVKSTIEAIDKVGGKIWGDKITVPKGAVEKFKHYMGRGFLQVEGSFKEEDNGKMKVKIADKEYKVIAEPTLKLPKALTIGSPKEGSTTDFNASVSVKNKTTFEADKKIVLEYTLVLYYGGQKYAVKTYKAEIPFELSEN